MTGCKATTQLGKCNQPVTSKPNYLSPTKWYGRKVTSKGGVIKSGVAHHTERILQEYCYFHQKVHDGLCK